jgi:hypothetical protein
MAEVEQALGWVDTMLETPQKERVEWVNTILNGIRSNTASYVYPMNQSTLPHRENSIVKATTKELENLVDYIKSSDFEIMGFAPNINYIRVKGSPEYLNAWWVHPFSSPALVVKHKKLPVIMLVGASIQKDRSTIYEVEPESKHILNNPVEGYTG